MNLPEMIRQIDQIRARRGRPPVGPAPSPDDEAEESETALEELRVAVEELHRLGDRLASSQDVAESERRRYREIFDLAPVGYVITDAYGAVLEANLAAAVLLNIRPQHLARKPLAGFLPEEARPAFRAALDRLGRTDRLDSFETRLLPRKLPPLHAALSASAHRDARGELLTIRWAVRDVSAQKRAEEALRDLNVELEGRVLDRTSQLQDQLHEHESLLIAAHDAAASGKPALDLIQGADAIFWRADAETGLYTFVSRQAEGLLGFPIEDWLSEPGAWTRLVHPEDREWAAKNRRRFVAEGSDHEAEYRMIAADGRTIWFRESVKVRRDEDGRVVELGGVMVNINKRKKVERQLYAAKQALSDELADVRYLHDLFGRLSPIAEPAPLLREVLESVAAVLGAEKGAIFLRDDARGGLALAAGLGLPEAFAGLVARIPEESAWHGRVLAIDEPLVVEDVLALPGHASHLQAIRAGACRGVLSVPILSRVEGRLGVVAILFDEPHRPPERQVQLVDRYVRKASDFVENALLRSRLREADRRKDEMLATLVRMKDEPLAAALLALESAGVPEATTKPGITNGNRSPREPAAG